MRRRERARRAMLLFVLYFVVIIGRGHGIFPVGLTLFFPEFPLPRITGWIGSGLLALALLPRNLQIYRIATGGGILLCYTSILLASLDSDAAPVTWVLSAPFAAYAYRWWGRAKHSSS
jgi:hypothetical protein